MSLSFSRELRVLGQLEGAPAVRTEAVRLPDRLDGRRGDAGDLRHGAQGPVGRLVRRRLVRQADDLGDAILSDRRDPGRARLVVEEAVDALVQKRSCQRQTQVLDLPVSAMMAFVPTPSPLRRTIRARQTCFCGLRGAAAMSHSRLRSAAYRVKVMRIPPHFARHQADGNSRPDSFVPVLNGRGSMLAKPTGSPRDACREILLPALLRLLRDGRDHR